MVIKLKEVDKVRATAVVEDLKDLVAVAMMESDINADIEQQRRRLQNEALLLFEEGEPVRISRKQLQPPSFVFSLEYRLTDGSVYEGGEVALELEKVDKVLKSFNNEDEIDIEFDADTGKCRFRRDYPRRTVTCTALSPGRFGAEWHWKSPYSYDSEKLTVFHNDEAIESAVACIPVNELHSELKRSAFTGFDKITLELKEGEFQLKLGSKLLYVESDISGVVRGEAHASYGAGFDNIISTLSRFGGDINLHVLTGGKFATKKPLFIYYDNSRIKLHAIVPRVLE